MVAPPNPQPEDKGVVFELFWDGPTGEHPRISDKTAWNDLKREHKAYWRMDMRKRHRLEREARVNGSIWDGKIPSSPQTRRAQGEDPSLPRTGGTRAGPSSSRSRISLGTTRRAACKPTSLTQLCLHCRNRPPWDNASDVSLDVIDEMVNGPCYQGPDSQELTSMPRGKWVILVREVLDPANCINARCLFRVTKIKNMWDLVTGILLAPPPILEYHGCVDPNPGYTTMSWVCNVYRRLGNKKQAPHEEMPLWDTIVVKIQNFRYGATLQEWLANRKKKMKCHRHGKGMLL